MEETRKTDPQLAERVLVEMQRYRPRLIVNQTRTRADLEIGAQVCSTGRRRLGLQIDYLGHLDSDDAVWGAVRKRRPLIVEHPESKVAKSIERIARKLMGAYHERPAPFEAPKRTEEQNLYELLEIDPGASDEEIRRAHRRARDMYANDSMVVCGLFSPERLTVVQQRIEEAHDALLDPEKRRQLDLKLFPDGIPARPPAPTPAQGTSAQKPPTSGARKEDTPLKVEIPAPPITPETEFTGSLLRQLRQARGAELLELSQRSKIAIGHLRAIEDEDWRAMPAVVYLRGFLVEYARFLRVDVTQVTRTYLARAQRGAKE